MHLQLHVFVAYIYHINKNMMSKLAIGEDNHNLLNVFTESDMLTFNSNISLLTYNNHKYIK